MPSLLGCESFPDDPLSWILTFCKTRGCYRSATFNLLVTKHCVFFYCLAGDQLVRENTSTHSFLSSKVLQLGVSESSPKIPHFLHFFHPPRGPNVEQCVSPPTKGRGHENRERAERPSRHHRLWLRIRAWLVMRSTGSRARRLVEMTPRPTLSTRTKGAQLVPARRFPPKVGRDFCDLWSVSRYHPSSAGEIPNTAGWHFSYKGLSEAEDG